MVFNSSTTHFNQFHAVNRDTYNHKSYTWMHWDNDGLSRNQVNAFRLPSTVGFTPLGEKTFLKEPLL